VASIKYLNFYSYSPALQNAKLLDDRRQSTSQSTREAEEFLSYKKKVWQKEASSLLLLLLDAYVGNPNSVGDGGGGGCRIRRAHPRARDDGDEGGGGQSVRANIAS